MLAHMRPCPTKLDKATALPSLTCSAADGISSCTQSITMMPATAALILAAKAADI